MRYLPIFVLSLSLGACGEVLPPGGGGNDAGPGPTATAVSPDHGPIVGGIEVSITGSQFQAGDAGDAQVVVGGVAATDVNVAGDGTVTFMLPPGNLEGDVVDVTVFNQNGFATIEDAFRYNERPVLLSITPSRGRGAGGTTVTITGRGFEDLDAGTNTVTLAGGVATNVVVVDDTTLTATSSASTAIAFSPQDIEVSNANGDATIVGGFMVTQPGLLAVERCCSNQVDYIDPVSHTVTVAGRLTSKINKCATSAAGTIFGTHRRGSDNQLELVTFDPLTGAVTPVGLTNLGATNRTIQSMAFVGNTLYGVTSRGTYQLVTINQSTGALTAVGAALSPSTSVNIAAKDANNLYFVDAVSETLDNLTTAGVFSAGAVTLTGPSGAPAHGLFELGGTLFMAQQYGNQLYTVNATSGVLTEIARFTGGGVGALCATPSTF